MGTTFVARQVEGSWVIQAVDIETVDARHCIVISLGSSFGDVEFQYEGLSHDVVHLYGKQKGPSIWDYFEVGTARPVDLYNPFDCQWARRGARSHPG